MALVVIPLLQIWYQYFVSSLFLLVNLSRVVSILLIFQKNQTILPIFSDFLFSISFISALILIIYFHSLTLDLICSSFSHSLRWMFRSLILDFSSFLLIIYSALYISNFDKLCLHFHLVQKYFLFYLEFCPLTHALFKLCSLISKYLKTF